MKRTVLVEAVPRVMDAIAKFSKKSVKLGYGEFNVVFGTPYLDQVIMEEVIDVEFDDKATEISIGNFEVIALVERFEDKAIIHNFGDIELPSEYRENNTFFCEHCNTNRKRKKVVILRNVNDNSFIQVGSTCVKDYTGYDINKMIALVNNVIDYFDTSSDFETFSDSTNSKCFYVQNILSLTVAAHRDRPWISAKAACVSGNISSSDLVKCIAVDKKELVKLEITDSEKEIAKNIINWFNTEANIDNDWLKNIKIFIDKGYVPFKFIGIVASLFIAYKMNKDKKVEVVNSEYVGNIKEKIEFDATIIKMQNIETNFGYSTIFTFKDLNENIFVWFSSTKGPADYELDKEYHVKGTVKMHKEFRGVKQTNLTRCKIK